MVDIQLQTQLAGRGGGIAQCLRIMPTRELRHQLRIRHIGRRHSFKLQVAHCATPVELQHDLGVTIAGALDGRLSTLVRR